MPRARVALYILLTFAVIASSLMLFGCSDSPQFSPEEVQSVDKSVDDALAKYNVPGMKELLEAQAHGNP